MIAAWCPVPITSESVSNDGISASSACDPKRKESAVCQRNHCTASACAPATSVRAEKSAMDARRLKPVVAKHACAVGERERHDNEIAAFNRSNVCADVFDHTYRFVPHHAASVAMLHFLIRPQIAPANARSGDADDSISRLDDLRIGHVLDPNVASAIHHSCRIMIYFRFFCDRCPAIVSRLKILLSLGFE